MKKFWYTGNLVVSIQPTILEQKIDVSDLGYGC